MATLNFDTNEFWQEILRRKRTGSGCLQTEPEEVAGRIYEVLRTRRPVGLLEGDNPVAYFDLTFNREARKYRHRELAPRNRLAGVPLLPLCAEVEPAMDIGQTGLHEMIAEEDRESLNSALGMLKPEDHELICALSGYHGKRVTLKEMANQRGISHQAIAKQRDRILGRLRAMLRRHAS